MKGRGRDSCLRLLGYFPNVGPYFGLKFWLCLVKNPTLCISLGLSNESLDLVAGPTNLSVEAFFERLRLHGINVIARVS